MPAKSKPREPPTIPLKKRDYLSNRVAAAQPSVAGARKGSGCTCVARAYSKQRWVKEVSGAMKGTNRRVSRANGCPPVLRS
jgi:hypothetical protein